MYRKIEVKELYTSNWTNPDLVPAMAKLWLIGPEINYYKTNTTTSYGITDGMDAVTDALKKELSYYDTPERVVFNGPATIVFWPDGTKTVVKCQNDEPFDPEKGVAMAIIKKYFGGGKYNNMINKLIKNATYETKK